MIKKRKVRKDLSLDKFKEELKNPSQNVYISMYTEEEVEVEPMPSNGRVTLKEVVDMIKKLDTKIDAGFKQVNDRLDYIVKANNLKDLPKNK